jgi:hypothetical protein
MRAALRSVSAAGLLLFLAVAVATFAGPRFFERQARAYLVERLRSEAVEMFPALRGIDVELAPVLCKYDCAGPGRLPALLRTAVGRLVLPDRLHRASEGFDRARAWAQQRFDGLVERLLRDVRLFALTNALMFLLAFLMASAEPLSRAVKIVSGALIGGATAGTLLYVFGQDWLQTLLFSTFFGWVYVVWVALIVAVELDILLNRARVLGSLLEAWASHPPH